MILEKVTALFKKSLKREKNIFPLELAAPVALSLTLADKSTFFDPKSAIGNFYNNFFALSSLPFATGKKVKIAGNEGVVESINHKYLVLKKCKSRVFIPTQNVLSAVVEVFN